MAHIPTALHLLTAKFVQLDIRVLILVSNLSHVPKDFIVPQEYHNAWRVLQVTGNFFNLANYFFDRLNIGRHTRALFHKSYRAMNVLGIILVHFDTYYVCAKLQQVYNLMRYKLL